MIITKNGREKYIQEKSTVLYGENNKPVKVIGIVQDITAEAQGDPLYDENGKIVGVIGTVQDITKYELLKQKFYKERENLIIAEQKSQETKNKLEHIANYDQLTGLPNSHNFKKTLNYQCKFAKERNLKGLRDLGIQIALDDFGTGYSALSYLTSFDMDILKIDGSFVKDITVETNKVIVRNIVNLAKELKIKVVAEGIEEWYQLEALQEVKCHSGQGYIYSKPTTTMDFEEILKNKKCKPQLVDKTISLSRRRKYFRVEFNQSLEAYLTIKEIDGRKVNIGNTKILVKNIGPGGLCFISNIRLPIDRDFVLQLESQLMEQDLKFNGKLAWAEEMGDNLHMYGIEFIVDEDERSELVKILNQVQIRMKNDILFAEGNFTSSSPAVYFNTPIISNR